MIVRLIGALGLAVLAGCSGTQPQTAHGAPRDYAVQFGRPPQDVLAFLNDVRDHVRSVRAGGNVAPEAARLRQEVARLDAVFLQRADVAGLVRGVQDSGGQVTRHWALLNAATFRLPQDKLRVLGAAFPGLRIEEQRAATPASTLSDSRVIGVPAAPLKTATNASNHNTDWAHAQGHKGAGATVAIIDTGQDPAEYPVYQGAGVSRLVANKKLGMKEPTAVTYHGVRVASVAAGAKWREDDAAADDGQAPKADILSYACADDSAGTTFSDGTFANAVVDIFNEVIAGRRVVATNFSYRRSGYDNPDNLAMLALDALAFYADIFVAVSAGHSSATPTSGSTTAAAGSPGAASVLAFGAVHAGTRAIWKDSARGPLHSDPQRNYPDLAANGVQVTTALGGNPKGSTNSTGTSLAAPHGTGAAALYRSAKPTASAVETKAAMLATCEGTATIAGGSANSHGQGYLRVDKLVQVAVGTDPEARTFNDQITAEPIEFTADVTAGRSYTAALAWDRADVWGTNWSNLRLEVRDSGGTLLAAADTPRNLYERVTFTAAATGTVVLRVLAWHIDLAPLPFGLVFVRTTDPPMPVMPEEAVAPGANRKTKEADWRR